MFNNTRKKIFTNRNTPKISNNLRNALNKDARRRNHLAQSLFNSYNDPFSQPLNSSHKNRTRIMHLNNLSNSPLNIPIVWQKSNIKNSYMPIEWKKTNKKKLSNKIKNAFFNILPKKKIPTAHRRKYLFRPKINRFNNLDREINNLAKSAQIKSNENMARRIQQNQNNENMARRIQQNQNNENMARRIQRNQNNVIMKSFIQKQRWIANGQQDAPSTIVVRRTSKSKNNKHKGIKKSKKN